MNKIRYERLNRIADNYKVLIDDNKIQNIDTGRKNGRLSSNGRYIAVNIQDKGKSYTYSLHEIVAFIQNEDLVGKEVNHIDGNRFNNFPENIEVITPMENKKHQKNNNLLSRVYGQNNGASKLKMKDIDRIKELYKRTKNYTAVGDVYAVCRNTIKDIIISKTWNVAEPSVRRS